MREYMWECDGSVVTVVGVCGSMWEYVGVWWECGGSVVGVWWKYVGVCGSVRAVHIHSFDD